MVALPRHLVYAVPLFLAAVLSVAHYLDGSALLAAVWGVVAAASAAALWVERGGDPIEL